ncbi:hypothetical protein BC332_27263 [Capsicum chinense]|nr:hypothetical protein BC332_27263 [Capsicum chinense]
MVDSQTSDTLKEFVEQLKKAKSAKVQKAISAKFGLGCSSSDPPLMVHSLNSDTSNLFDDRSKNTVNAKEEKAISAKFGLEFCSSDSQTSDSSNELDDRSKKAEHAIVKKAISAKFGLEFCSSDTQTSDSSNELDDRSKNAENAIVKEVSSAKFELGNSSSDPSSTVDSQTSDSSNDQESEQELWMGQWIRISGDKEVKFSQKLGVLVVDNYGFFLGHGNALAERYHYGNPYEATFAVHSLIQMCFEILEDINFRTLYFETKHWNHAKNSQNSNNYHILCDKVDMFLFDCSSLSFDSTYSLRYD